MIRQVMIKITDILLLHHGELIELIVPLVQFGEPAQLQFFFVIPHHAADNSEDAEIADQRDRNGQRENDKNLNDRHLFPHAENRDD